MRKKKKSSLSLSMNAIVILILAITLLGLGLSFMRGLFKQMEIKTRSAIDAHELTNPPTRDTPITTAPGVITLREGKRGKVLVAFMNTEPGNGRWCQLTMLDNTGTKIDPDATNALVIYSDEASQMGPDQINTWTLSVGTALLSADSTAIATTRICCDDSASKPATVECAKANKDGIEFRKDIVINVIA